MMDIFTKGALWDCWKLGSDEIKPTNEKTSNLEETNHDDEQEIGEIFRIETNLFNYETPLCKKFKEFNYLLKIELAVLTKYIKGFKTYEEYMSGIKMCHGCMKNHGQRMNWRKDGYCNGENLPGAYIVGNSLHYQDFECLINEDDESSNDGWRSWENFENINSDRYEREYENDPEDEERCELFDDATQELPICTVRRFKMIK
ncbi:hypothetical protein Tco_1487113 [Tanacetum coccineum]